MPPKQLHFETVSIDWPASMSYSSVPPRSPWANLGFPQASLEAITHSTPRLSLRLPLSLSLDYLKTNPRATLPWDNLSQGYP